MTQADFQQLADKRVREAEALLAAGLWDGAYYLVGYAVECGLKACVIKYLGHNPGTIFDDSFALKNYWTHGLATLVTTAGLKAQLDTYIFLNADFEKNWKIVTDWKEDARYKPWAEQKARELFRAVTDLNSGVLPWIKTHW